MHDKDKFLTLVAPFIHDDTKLIFNVATLITIMETEMLNLSSIAQTTDEFIGSMNKDYFQRVRENTLTFIAEIKSILNKIKI